MIFSKKEGEVRGQLEGCGYFLQLWMQDARPGEHWYWTDHLKGEWMVSVSRAGSLQVCQWGDMVQWRSWIRKERVEEVLFKKYSSS